MKREMEVATTTLETPIGELRIEATSRGVRRIDFHAGASRAAKATADPAAQSHLERAVRQLREYFAGVLTTLAGDDDIHGLQFFHGKVKITQGHSLLNTPYIDVYCLW